MRASFSDEGVQGHVAQLRVHVGEGQFRQQRLGLEVAERRGGLLGRFECCCAFHGC
jgi:hypothetical protein